jgi:hypothetical protein
MWNHWEHRVMSTDDVFGNGHVTFKLTVPALERLIEKHPNIELELSHAAVKQISEKFMSVFDENRFIKEATNKINSATSEMQKFIGEKIAAKLGSWDNGVWNNGYSIRADIEKQIKNNFQKASP